jgi:LacI family transcriptional regulator
MRCTPAPDRSTTVCALGIRPMRASGLLAAANLQSFMDPFQHIQASSSAGSPIHEQAVCALRDTGTRRALRRPSGLEVVPLKGPTAMTVKMKDIAKDLGVSVITVSKVLRNHPEVGRATRERVLARVKELDYRPNLAARSLVTGRTYLVGLIVPDLLHPFFAEIAKSLSDVLRKSGYFLIIASSEEDPDLERQEVDQLLARQLDTLIIASCRPTAELLVRIERHKTPYILIDRTIPGASANYVGVDDVAVGRLATEHLIAIGCKRIAHIRGPQTSTGIARLEGYKRALARRGITIDDRYITSLRKVDVDSKQRGADAMAQLLRLKPEPDGVFCYNDPLATGAMDYAIEHGVRIPEDVAIIGSGNLHYNDSLRVGLSSIDQHSRRIGEAAARIALGILGSQVPPAPETVILQPELVIRASTRRKARRRSR